MAESTGGQMNRRQNTKKESDGLIDRISRFFKNANEQSGIGQIRKANEAKAKQERQRKNLPSEVAMRERKQAEAKAKSEKYKKKAAENKANSTKSAPKRTTQKPDRNGQMPEKSQAKPTAKQEAPKQTSKTSTAKAGKTDASSFKSAFARARKAYMSGKGGTTFSWNGKKYSVATKDDIQKSGKKDLKDYLNAGMTPKRK